MKGEGFLVCRITEDQLQSFYGLIPSDLKDALTFPESYALAAVTEDSLSPAGILIFRFRRGPEDELLARGDWLYIPETYRRRGIGTLLTRHLQGLLSDAGIRETVFEFPDREENALLSEFLKNRGYAVEKVCVPRNRYSLGELKKAFDAMGKTGKPAVPSVPLCDLPFHEVKNRLKKELLSRGQTDTEGLLKREEGFFEPEISCAAKKEGEIRCLLLTQKLPSGKLVLWHLTAPDAKEGKSSRTKLTREAAACIENALSTALYAYGKKTEVTCGDALWQEEFACLLEDRGASLMMRAVRWED